MSTGTGIEWTDATWVVTTGCTEASTGCAQCYARRLSKRLGAMAAADIAKGRSPGQKADYSLAVREDGRWSGIVKPVTHGLDDPIRWRRPRRVFVNSMSDLFWGTESDLAEARRRGVADPQPVPFEFVDRVFGMMACCPQHTFQALTKRPERMAEYLNVAPAELATRWHEAAKAVLGYDHPKRRAVNTSDLPLRNIWFGVSAENQACWDQRTQHLRRCPAAVRFVSAEPLLAHIDITLTSGPAEGINWIIVGCESRGAYTGRGAADYPDHARRIIEDAQAAGIAVFHKQMPVGRKVSGDPREWPTWAQIREFPR